MLILDAVKLESLKFLSPDDCDAVLISSRRGRAFVESHQTVLQLRVLNLSVQNVHTHSQLVQRYRLSYNRVTGTVNFPFERPAYPEGRLRCGSTDAFRALAAHLKNGWLSYVTISAQLSHFVGSVILVYKMGAR